MKKFNSFLGLLLIVVTMFMHFPVVNATGTAVLGFSGNSTVEEGATLTVTVVMSNINGVPNGVAGFQANLVYDSEYLEFKESSYGSNPLGLDYSDSRKVMSGAAMSDRGFITASSANMIELKFTAKKIGKTSISLTKTEVSAGDRSLVTTTNNAKEIEITGPKSTNNNLSSLVVEGYNLTPTFNKNTTSYTAEVPNSVTSAVIKFTAEDSTATVTGNGTVNANNLTVGDNKYTIVVTAQSGAKKNYVVTIKRAAAPVTPKDSDNTLKGLSVDGYTIDPAFNKDTTDYSITVPSNVNDVTVNAEKNSSKATVKIEGNTGLKPGENIVKVTVTAEDGSTKVYNIKVNKESEVASNDATLKSLGVSGYDMSPNFSNDTLNYNVTVPNEANSVTINTETNNPKAKVEITGNTDLKVGENKVTVKVIAEDGTTKTFTVNVKKEDKPAVKLDSDATLKSLNVSGQSLNPAFNKDISVYNLEVGSSVSKIDVNAIPTSDKATVSVTGNTNLKNGMNTVIVTVTAEDGSKNVYILNVNKKSASTPSKKSDDSYLSSLGVSGAELSPSFNKDNTNYSVTVPYDVEKLEINYNTSNNKAKVEIIGNDELKVGKVNAIQVKVTAEDGSVRIYTINATRSAQESNNKLKTLIVGGYTISPSFDKDIYNYKVTIKSKTDKLDLTALAENPNAKVEIIGNSDLKVGNNTVLIKVTDENGFMRLYQLDVQKNPFTIMGMSVGQFISFLLLGLGLLGILFFLILLLKRKNDKQEKSVTPVQPPQTPIIDFKPEFNFGSRNGTDDDVVYPNGVLNQGSTISNNASAPKKLMDNVDDAYYEELADTIYEDNGLFDETITKDELIAAIREGMQTKNTDKLKMLLKQDELNQLKKKVKKDEERKSRSDRY